MKRPAHFHTTLVLAFAFLVVAAGICQLGSLYLEHSRTRFRGKVEDELKAIADLKVRQIVEWREERLGDAHAILVNPLLADDVQRFFNNPAPGGEETELTAWLEGTRLHNQSRRALLLDSNLSPRLASPADHTNLGPTALAFARRAMESKQVVLSGLHHGQPDGYIHLDLEIPLYASFATIQSNVLKTDFSRAQLLGVLDLELDPFQLLYPLLQSWPTPSQTAESLLVRREGDEVLYLNELRHKKQTALALRLPLSLTNNPCVLAVLGREGSLSGLDYRQQPVLANVRKVPGSDWFLIAKVDEQEIFAPFKTERRLVLLAMLSLLSVLALGSVIFWRWREARFLRQEMIARERMEAVVRQSEERYRLFLENFQGIAYQIDLDAGRVITIQGQVERMTGYAPEQFITGAVNWMQLVHPEDQSLVESAARQLMTESGHVADYTYRIRRRDAQPRWVNDVGRSAVDPATGHRILQGAVYDVTQRVEAERQLLKLSRAVEASPVSIVVTDLAGNIEYVNPKFCALTGYTAQEVRGRNTRILKSGTMPPGFYQNLWQTILAGGEWKGEFHNRKKNGELYWELASITGIKDPAGRLTHFVAVKEDITGRKQVEQSLRLLSSAVEQSSESMLMLEAGPDPVDSKILFANSAFTRLRGYTAEEVVGKTPRALQAFPTDRSILPEVRQTLGRGEVFHGQATFLRKDGKEIDMEWVITPLRGESEKITHFVSVQRDITQRNRTERERSRLAAIIEATPDFVGIADAKDQRLVYLNRAGRLMTGIDLQQDITALSINDFVPPANKSMAFAELLPTVLATGVWTGETGLWHQCGQEIPVLMTVMTHKSAKGEIEVLSNVSRDITQRKQAEAELNRLHQQLLETARQAGMAEVATSVLHNVGNVLNTVNITSSLLLEKARTSKAPNLSKAARLLEVNRADPGVFLTQHPKGKQLPAFLCALGERLLEEQAEIIQELTSLQKGIEHIKEIVAMQQSYARVAGIVEPLLLEDLVEDAFRMCSSEMEQLGIKVLREYGTPSPIHTEKHKVLQILVNLISNAKHSLRDAPGAEKRLILRTEALPQARVKISIIDNGAGISSENRQRIFELGFTTRKNGHGFGLHNGALVARELGGVLSAHSDGPGRGASFVLELPHQCNGEGLLE